jgi:hypothetical protein
MFWSLKNGEMRKTKVHIVVVNGNNSIALTMMVIATSLLWHDNMVLSMVIVSLFLVGNGTQQWHDDYWPFITNDDNDSIVMIVTLTIVACMLFFIMVPNHNAMVIGLLLLTMTPSDDNGDINERTKRRKNDENNC